MPQTLHQFEPNESTRAPAALRPPVLTDWVVQPSSSPPPPPPLAAVSSITPFPLILFLLEDEFRPSCRADLLVSHPLSLHPSSKRRQGERGLQGNIKKVRSIHHHHLSIRPSELEEKVMRCCSLCSHHNCITTEITSITCSINPFSVRLSSLCILCMVLHGFSPFFLWVYVFLMNSAPLPSPPPIPYDSCRFTGIFLLQMN